MKLHVESSGNGRDLVLLHGWGLHGGLWGSVADELAGSFRVHRVDLPGHARSTWDDEATTLEDFAAAVRDVLPERCILLGWSLGGIVALCIAAGIPGRRASDEKHIGQMPSSRDPVQKPSRSVAPPAALVLVCSTPRFLAAPDWTCGMRAEALEDFAQRLEDDYAGTVQDFLALQVQGESRGLNLLRQMKQALQSAPAPHPAALRAGLEILRQTDLRAQLPKIAQPALIISGALDRMTPAAAGRYLAEHLPAARFELFKKAAHAPFLSDPSGFANAVVRFAALDPPR